MRVENLSIKAATVFIFVMIAIVAIVLSLFAGNYFRQSALDAQMNNLSRVIEVASQEMFRQVKGHAFDLGMKLGNSAALIEALEAIEQPGGKTRLVALLDDPFVNGFVGVAKINMVRLRVYDLDLHLLAESSRGVNLAPELPAYLDGVLRQRRGVERLKAVDGLWNSARGPLSSTVVPVGGLRLKAYLEVVTDPVFNFPDIGRITKTPVNVFSASGEALSAGAHETSAHFLPVEFNLLTSDGELAFRIVGYENVETLNAEMEATRTITISSFLLLSMLTLAFALWLFNRFLFVPVSRMIADMEQIAGGNMEAKVNRTGLREFYLLANSFNVMADQVKIRTDELRDSQNRLRHLLDLDKNAILYFALDQGVLYFNSSASALFGYDNGEINDLEFADLFVEDAAQLQSHLNAKTGQNRARMKMQCRAKTGVLFQCHAVVSQLQIMAESGYAVVISPDADLPQDLTRRLTAGTGDLDASSIRQVEQSLKRIVEIAADNPALLLGLDVSGLSGAQLETAADKKVRLRERAVAVMNAVLACWEYELGKSKVDLADASGIWPVYMDKSTPTTRTLDKYLHIDTCPKNPRCHRVVDTAEFVLRQSGDQQSLYRQKLAEALEALRQTMSGV